MILFHNKAKTFVSPQVLEAVILSYFIKQQNVDFTATGNLKDAFYLRFRGKDQVRKCNCLLAKSRVMVPGIPYIDSGNWGQERDIAHL